MSNKRNKRIVEAFCGIYTVILFGCVFFHIESWPFSDFRVFASASHPSHHEAIRLGVVHKGKRTWLFEADDFSVNEYVVSKFSHSYRDEQLRPSIERQLRDEFLDDVHKKYGTDFDKFVLFGINVTYQDHKMAHATEREVLVIAEGSDAR